MDVKLLHSLLHTVADARKFGPLSNISCFPFENYLGNLKKLIRKPQNPVAQILARLDELAASRDSNVNLSCANSACHKFQHFDGPVMPGLGECQ